MLNDLELPKLVLKHKKFQIKTKEFFQFIKFFTSYEDRHLKSQKEYHVYKPVIFNDEKF